MDLIAQIRIAGLAVALFLCLAVQLPAIDSIRWWLYATALGFSAALVERFAGGQPASRLGSVLLLLLCAEIGCISAGVLWQRSRVKHARAGFAASLLGGCVLITLAHGSAKWLAVSGALVLLGILAVLLGYLWKKRERHPWPVSIISGILLLEGLHELVSAATVLGWAQPDFLPMLHSAAAFIGFGGPVIALLYIVLDDVGLRDHQLQGREQHLRQVVDATDHGICEIDRGGLITYANAAAAGMLGIAGNSPSEVWIQEKLKADDDESSIRAISEFVLRPYAPVSRATARILCPDRPPIWVDWSSSPKLEDGKPVGATVTLVDVSDREASVRFVRFRTELLEMIARNKPADEIARLLGAAVEERLPGYCCSVLICDGEYFRAIASPLLPEGLRSALNAVPCNRILQTNDQKGSIELKSWEDALRGLARNYQLGGLWSEPMVSVANELLGTVVIHHAFMAPLQVWQTRILHEAARLGALSIEHQIVYERLLHQGYHDALTGLPNRLLLADRLQQALARAERNHMQLAYLSIDLDHFKDVNDSFGHDAGDLFLRQISARLATRVRASDTLARTGGDEFTLILPDLQDLHDAGKVAESLTQSLRDPFQLHDRTVYGSASIGIAIYPGDGMDAATLQRNADRAMYRAKAQGRNLVQFYSSEEAAQDRNRIEIETQLHRAIEQGSFSLHYQPQFNCDHRLEGFEALLRFQHPKLGMVPPSRFIPMAEESGLIIGIGEWVLHEACRQIVEWQEKGLRPVHVAINVSPLQLAHGDFAGTVARILRATGVRPELLEFEFTEGVLMSGVQDSANQISEIAKIGVRLSVDDFGTGYSCLSYLHQLPLHTLKIDRSFVTRILDPDGTRCIVEAIVTLARNLHLRTVAEGVESDEQLAVLRAAGCELIQGFLFSRPLSAIDASRLLWEHTVSDKGARIELVPPSNAPYRLAAPSKSPKEPE